MAFHYFYYSTKRQEFNILPLILNNIEICVGEAEKSRSRPTLHPRQCDFKHFKSSKRSAPYVLSPVEIEANVI